MIDIHGRQQFGKGRFELKTLIAKRSNEILVSMCSGNGKGLEI
jgi:hypothetical protein